MNSVKNAVYLAIFLHMARKIFAKANTPRPRVKVKGVNGKKFFQADPARVHEAARNIRSSYSEEPLYHMTGVDVAAMLKESLEREVSEELSAEMQRTLIPSMKELTKQYSQPLTYVCHRIYTEEKKQVQP